MLYARRQQQEWLNGGVFDKEWIHGEGDRFVRWRIRQELDELADRGDSTQLAALARFLETNRGKLLPAPGAWLSEALEHRRRRVNGAPERREARPTEGETPRPAEGETPRPVEGETPRRAESETPQREGPVADDAAPADDSSYHPLIVRGRTIEFYVYTDPRGAEARAKIDELARYFERLPDTHLDVLWPFFAMRIKPDNSEGGGTWNNRGARIFHQREERTGVPPADVQRLVIDRGRGMIGCSGGRWRNPVNRLRFTVLHEVAHNVDNVLRLTPPDATEADFLGIDPANCGFRRNNPFKARIIEAYARYIVNPGGLINKEDELPEGETREAAAARVIAALRRSPAFRDVPESWQPR